jgi:hypothetical protein
MIQRRKIKAQLVKRTKKKERVRRGRRERVR